MTESLDASSVGMPGAPSSGLFDSLPAIFWPSTV